MATLTKKKKKTKFGRKPVEDRSIQVAFWIKGSVVKSVGGMGEAREICIEALKKKSNGK